MKRSQHAEEKDKKGGEKRQSKRAKEADEQTKKDTTRLELETLKGVVQKAKLEIEKEVERWAKKENPIIFESNKVFKRSERVGKRVTFDELITENKEDCVVEETSRSCEDNVHLRFNVYNAAQMDPYFHFDEHNKIQLDTLKDAKKLTIQQQGSQLRYKPAVTELSKPGPSGLQKKNEKSLHPKQKHSSMATELEKRHKTDEDKLLESSVEILQTPQKRDTSILPKVAKSTYREIEGEVKRAKTLSERRRFETIKEVEENSENINVPSNLEVREIGINTEKVYQNKLIMSDTGSSSQYSSHTSASKSSLPSILQDEEMLTELKSVHKITNEQLRELCKVCGYSISDEFFFSGDEENKTVASDGDKAEGQKHTPACEPRGSSQESTEHAKNETQEEHNVEKPESDSAADTNKPNPEVEKLIIDIEKDIIKENQNIEPKEKNETDPTSNPVSSKKSTIWGLINEYVINLFRSPSITSKTDVLVYAAMEDNPKTTKSAATIRENENIPAKTDASTTEAKLDEHFPSPPKAPPGYGMAPENVDPLLKPYDPREFLFRFGYGDIFATATKNKQTQTLDLKLDDEIVMPDGMRGVDAKVNVEPEEEKQRVLTGHFADGLRRTDLVLVLNRTDTTNPKVEEIKLDFFLGLLKTGMQIETEIGTLREHRQLDFVKLHATDAVLNTYAGPFGVRKYFRDSHEQMITYRPFHLTDVLFRHRFERENLRTLRRRYKKPLRLTTLDRSYIAYMLLRHKTFGRPENYYGLERLINNKIVLDAYALHDGPAVPNSRPNASFNNRQLLYLNWFRFPHLFKDQPAHLLYEYYGAKVSFYFIFHEFYNKGLLIMSIWGAFMTGIYLIKDQEYFKQMREFICEKANTRDKNYLNRQYRKPNRTTFNAIAWRSLMCAECEGVKATNICPYSMIEDYCLDMRLMRFIDNPYIVMHSMGLCLFGLFFMAMWTRTEDYWRWIWEETSHPRPAPTRGLYNKKTPLTIRWGTFRPSTLLIVVWERLKVLLIYCGIHVFVPFIIIIFIITSIFGVFIYGHQFTRPLSVTKIEFKDPKLNIIPPKINRVSEYGYFVLTVLLLLFLFYIAEMLYHSVAYKLTQAENHWFHHHFEQSLIHKYFAFSMIYTACLVFYFAWLKDAFYFSPVHGWDIKVHISIYMFSWDFKLSAMLPKVLLPVVRRVLTMNCGPFSCFRQASIVFILTISVRIFLIGVIDSISRRIQMMKIQKTAKKLRLPVVEREYRLQPITEDSIDYDINKLMLQFAFVFLFAPLFPLAPILPFIVNVWDIRTKAMFYIRHSRRPVLFRKPGLGSWNEIMKLICYAMPVVHAITISRTEVLKRYLFHLYSSSKVIKHTPTTTYNPDSIATTRDMSKYAVEEDFINFLLFYNFNVTKTAENHPGFREVNKNRSHTQKNDKNMAFAFVFDNNTAFMEKLMYCRVDGFFESLGGKTQDRWPYQWNYMEDNTSMNIPESWHYRLKMHKTFFVLVYIFGFALIALLMARYFGKDMHVARRRMREHHLRRLQMHELRFVREPTQASVYIPPLGYEHTAPLAQAGLIAGRMHK